MSLWAFATDTDKQMSHAAKITMIARHTRITMFVSNHVSCDDVSDVSTDVSKAFKMTGSGRSSGLRGGGVSKYDGNISPRRAIFFLYSATEKKSIYHGVKRGYFTLWGERTTPRANSAMGSRRPNEQRND